VKVAIIFDQIDASDVLADRDVLQQVKIVVDSLKRLGHNYILCPCTLDLIELKDWMIEHETDVAFNLVDTLDSKDCLSHLPIAVLEANGIKHTGPLSLDVAITTRKLLAKSIIQSDGILSPKVLRNQTIERENYGPGTKWIIKSDSADGSKGMHDSSVVSNEKHIEIQDGFFAEQYIDGREFTVPFLCGKTLPIVEVTYENYPDGKPKILGQEAKWQPESFESKHTGIDFPEFRESWTLEMRSITDKCMTLFNLNGWGRIDFRVDKEGQIYVIDINANSCLAPDAWWSESLKHAGIEFDQAIQSILEDVT
jgi:D-alanine-D-alanine ligase